MSSFFGKKRADANATSTSTSAPAIRQETRRIVRPQESRPQQQQQQQQKVARPAPRQPPADRFNLTPNARAARRSTNSSPAQKSRTAAIRGGQKRKSASPAAPIFGSDDDESSSASDSSSSSRPAKINSHKKQRTTVPPLDTSRQVRDLEAWPSQEKLDDDKYIFPPSQGLIHGCDLCTGSYAKDYQPIMNELSSEEDGGGVEGGDTASDGSGGGGVATVHVQYPSPSAPESFALAEPKKPGDYRPVEDIVNTVVEVLKHYLPERASERLLQPSESGPNTTLEFRLRRAFRQKSLADFRDALDEYNQTMVSHLRSGQVAAHMDDRIKFPSPLRFDLVKRVLAQIYARTVSPRVEMLSKYANKENTYGELREPFASQIFKDVGLKSDHVFLDLGSGVGNVVLQAALEVGCKSYGIEMMENPCRLADAQAAEFPRRAKLWGLSPGPVTLWQGDFLDDALVSKLLSSVDVVLVNNEVFGPNLNNALKDRLLDLKEGARVVSLKSFVPDGWKLAQHTRNDPIAGLEVRQKQFWSNWVSWKYEGGDYFVATKDSGRIERILGR